MRMSEKELAELLNKNPSLRSALGIIPGKSSRNKYRNVKVYVYPDGFVSEGEKLEGHGKFEAYDSIKEYNRWNELLLLERARIISNLSRQRDVIIEEGGMYNGKSVCAIKYRADFSYIRDGKEIIEDVKPIDKKTGKPRTTKDFNLKWKLLKLKYPKINFEIY